MFVFYVPCFVTLSIKFCSVLATTRCLPSDMIIFAEYTLKLIIIIIIIMLSSKAQQLPMFLNYWAVLLQTLGKCGLSVMCDFASSTST